MKLLNIFVITCLVFNEASAFGSALVDDWDNLELKSSISEIVREQFSHKILYVLHDNDWLESFGGIINHVLGIGLNITVQIENFNKLVIQPEKRRNVILFIDSFDSFQRFYEAVTDNLFNFDGFFLIVCSDLTEEHVNTMFRELWEKFLYNVDLLSQVDGNVKLQTFMPFNEMKCFDTDAKIINIFSNATLKWDSNEFFQRKLRNLHNCPLRIATYEYPPAVIVRTKFLNGSHDELTGSDIELLKGLSKVLNFQIDLKFQPNFGDWGVLYANGTATGAMKLLISNQTDGTIGWGYMTDTKLHFISASEEYFMVPLGFVVPPGRPYSALEKLLIPFDWKVWLLVLLAITVAILVIFFAERRSKQWRDLIIGREVKNPFWELLVVLFGESSQSIPRQQFPRYLLMMFLLFCLVMRTVYLSGLFKFMQSDKKGNQVATIDEMINENFRIYSYEALEPIWENLKFRKISQSAPDQQIKSYWMQTLDPELKVGVIATYDEIVYQNQFNLKNYSHNVCKEQIMMIHVTMFFQKNSYLKEAFDRKIKALKPNGLINHWISQYMDYKYLQVKQVESGPEKLNLQQLLGAFKVWAFGLSVSLLFLFVELIVNFLEKQKLRRTRFNNYQLSSN